MRSSETGNFFMVDKAAIQLLKSKKGNFSEFEAYCSFSMDVNCGKDWTISGYSNLWGWSRNKVRKFTNNLLSSKGHQRDTKRTLLGHPIHVITRENSAPKDSEGTVKGQRTDTTIKTKSNTKKQPTIRYSDNFELFWKEYPNKQGKKKAYASWKKQGCDNGLFETIMSSLKAFKNSDGWKKDNGQFIPHGVTWVNGSKWEDETQNNGGSRF